MSVGVLSTEPFHGYAVIFSPFSGDKLSVVGGVNYGLAGPGGMIVYQDEPGSGFKEIRRYNWKDLLFDVTWSEIHEPVLVAGSGDGSVLLFDQTKPQGLVSVLQGHTAEVCSVEWSVSRKEQLVLTSSWDSTVRIWDTLNGICVSVWEGHKDKVYQARWSPRIPSMFASVSGDGELMIWDVSTPQKVIGRGHVGGGEVLTCSWNKYDENIILTGGTDKVIRVWDIRKLMQPLSALIGHTQSIKCVSFDPHSPCLLASTGYDSSVKFWNTQDPSRPHLLQTISHHKEFTLCVNFSLHERGVVVDCSWDKTLKVYTPSCLSTTVPPPLPPLDPPPC